VFVFLDAFVLLALLAFVVVVVLLALLWPVGAVFEQELLESGADPPTQCCSLRR
jgi:hypothetical protein